MIRFCKKCNENFDLTHFYVRPDGFYSCKITRQNSMKKYRLTENGKNKERLYRNSNIDKYREYVRKHREKNSEKIKIKENSLENIDKRKKRYQKNKKKLLIKQNERHNNRYRSDLKYRLRCILRSRFRFALKGNFKSGSAVRDLGCSIEQLKLHLESKFQPGMTWENYGQWHIDHIQPLSSFDLTDLEQIKIACHYTNLQPLWAVDNLRKSSKVAS